MEYIVKVSETSATRRGHYMGTDRLLTSRKDRAEVYASIVTAAADVAEWIENWQEEIRTSVTFDVVLKQPEPVVATITKQES